MALIEVKVLIKELRKLRGLTQEQLAQGICSRKELSRIENGKVMPDWFVFEKLMQKLGEDPQKYYKGLVTEEDRFVLQKKNEIKQLLNIGDSEEAEKCLNEMKSSRYFRSDDGRQFVLRTESAIAYIKQYPDIAYQLAVKAIKITIPCFAEIDISGYALTTDEISIINNISAIYHLKDDLENALRVSLALKASMDKFYFDETEKVKLYSSLLLNIAIVQEEMKQYANCIETCNLGLEYCEQWQVALQPPLFLCCKGYALCYLGQVDEGKICLRRSCAYLDAVGRYQEHETIKNDIEQYFGFCIEGGVSE